jgi:hypothetical protein
MLKYNEINPLNVFGLRQIEHCPPHFERVTFNIAVAEKQITDWIYENLEGRFHIGPTDITVARSEGATTHRYHCVAFEVLSEASYFSLTLSQINKLI